MGFARDILIAGFFGTGSLIQAFIVAFRIPNLLRQMVGEGATNAAFVPVLSEYLAVKRKEDYWRLAGVIFNLLIVVLAVIVIIGVIAAPLLVRVIAPGFAKDPGHLELAVKLTRIIFPYILLIGLVAFAGGILNSLRHFAAPAFGPCLLNISFITAILLNYESASVTALAIAVLVGGGLQLALQASVLYKKGMRIKRPFELRHPAASKIGQLRNVRQLQFGQLVLMAIKLGQLRNV